MSVFDHESREAIIRELREDLYDQYEDSKDHYAELGEAALLATTDYHTDREVETHAKDLIVNILHLCDKEGISVTEVLEGALFRYEHEDNTL